MLNTIKTLFTVPFKVFRFIIYNAFVYGIFSGTKFICKTCFKATKLIFMNPLVIGIVLGGISTYILIDEDRRKKVLGMIGL